MRQLTVATILSNQLHYRDSAKTGNRKHHRPGARFLDNDGISSMEAQGLTQPHAVPL